MFNPRFALTIIALGAGRWGMSLLTPHGGLPATFQKDPYFSRIGRLIVTVVGLSMASFIQAESFDCQDSNCHLYSQEAYPNFVVGTVKAVATDEQAGEVFTWAKENGYWKLVPDDEARFVELVQVMSIAIPEGDDEIEMSLLMSREEYDSSPINPGDFVRYTRHRTDEPMTPLFRDQTTKPYWDLFGCIAILCREDDKPCPARYAPGVYRFEDGVPLDRLTDTPNRDGQRIDTETFLPLAATGNATEPTD